MSRRQKRFLRALRVTCFMRISALYAIQEQGGKGSWTRLEMEHPHCTWVKPAEVCMREEVNIGEELGAGVTITIW